VGALVGAWIVLAFFQTNALKPRCSIFEKSHREPPEPLSDSGNVTWVEHNFRSHHGALDNVTGASAHLEPPEPFNYSDNFTWVEQNLSERSKVANELLVTENNKSHLNRSCADGQCWDYGAFGDETFKLSCKQMKQTQSSFGDTEARARLLDKLKSGRCITVLAFGGSITYGNWIGPGGDAHQRNAELAFPANLKRWLDLRFPCSSESGHDVQNWGHPAVGSNVHVSKVQELAQQDYLPLLHSDWVIVDTAHNDDDQLKHEDDIIKLYTELLARQLLSVPSHPALVWLVTTWNLNGRPPYYNSAWHTHEWVLHYYNIPQLSVITPLLPNLTNVATNSAIQKLYKEGNSLHPKKNGHKILAQILVHWLLAGCYTGPPQVASDAIFNQPVRLPAPMVASQDDVSKFGLFSNFLHIDFTNDEWKEANRFQAHGWMLGEDVPGKPGFLATAVGAKLLLGLNLQSSKKTLRSITLGFLSSYENMGTMKVSIKVPRNVSQCERLPEVSGEMTQQTETVDCLWSQNLSIHSVHVIHMQIPKCMVLEVDVADSFPVRVASKIKLLDLSIRT